jgi:hypothetical protein
MAGNDELPEGDSPEYTSKPESFPREREVLARVADEEAHQGSLTLCHDCGIDAWHFRDLNGVFVHEDFYVSSELWDATCPDDDVIRWRGDGIEYEKDATFGVGNWVLCIGCFEKRLGRKLTRADLTARPAPLFGTPASLRFKARYRTTSK